MIPFSNYIRIERPADIAQVRELIDDILNNNNIRAYKTVNGSIEIRDVRGLIFSFVLTNVSQHRRGERYELWMTWYNHPVAEMLRDEHIMNILYKYRSAKTPNIFQMEDG